MDDCVQCALEAALEALRDSKPAPYPEAREQHSEAIKLVKLALAAPTMPAPVETATPCPF
jgi:hypothetical protein